MKTMVTEIERLLFEAYRRNAMIDSANRFEIEKAKPFTKRWLGLGTEAAYRPAIRAGLMVFHDGKTPPPRCMGWLILTKKGAIAYKEHENRLSTKWKSILKDPDYQRSLLAHYQLAGGLTL